MNYNKIIVGGRLTRNPESKVLSSGKTVVSFALAVNRKSGDKEEVLFLNCQAWDKTGDVVMKYVKKGEPLFVEGRLREEKWRDKEGQDKSKMVVVVDVVQLLGSKNSAAPAREAAPVSEPQAKDVSEEEIPF